MVTPSPKSDNGNLVGGGIVVGLIVLVFAIGQWSSESVGDNTAAPAIDTNTANEIAAQEPPPPESLSGESMNRGINHLRIAFAAEGFPGAMIYSQNCYEGLGQQFTWSQLDTCGAFDMLASRSVATADIGQLIDEPDYFQSESSATRYLTAAVAAGQTGADADQRLSQLQSRVGRARLVGQTPAATNETASESENWPRDPILNELVENAEAYEQKRED